MTRTEIDIANDNSRHRDTVREAEEETDSWRQRLRLPAGRRREECKAIIKESRDNESGSDLERPVSPKN